MTRKLSDLFGFPDTESDQPIGNSQPSMTVEETRTALAEVDKVIDKIDDALPAVRGLDSSDAEMDELASLAVQSFKDLTDLGFNVDSRYSSEILSVASTMLGHALTAKTAKLNKKLKMVQLQIQKATLDQRLAKAEGAKAAQAEDIPLGEGQVLTRNDLIQRLMSDEPSQSDK